MRNMVTELGGLTCRIIEGDKPELNVVLCHGFGAPGTDLVPLAQEIVAQKPEIAERVRWVFPAAPLDLEAYGGFGDARAWWLIDFQRLAASMSGGRGIDMRREMPEGLTKARHHLLALIEELSLKSGLGIGRFVLGGFSQGAMLTTDVTLRLEEPPAGLMILSGTLICEDAWIERAPIRKGLKVLQSHGQMDPILPFENAEALRDLLLHAGLEVDFVPFMGPHTIPFEMLGKMAEYIEARL